MKKILFFCSVLFANLLLAQGQISVINSPLDVEVGIPYTFTFQYKPPTNPPGINYKLDFWTITAPVSGTNISGNINGQTNGSYLYTQSANTIVNANDPSKISVSITFGDQAPQNSIIAFIPSGNFIDAQGNRVPIIVTAGVYAVRVRKIKAPTISPATILDCSNENVQICASDYDDANSFTWNITGGTIVPPGNSSCITVSPNTKGNVTATCLVKRSTGLASYTATSTKAITRAARTHSFVTNPVQDYICKGSGLVFQYANQSGLTIVNWNAPNCTVSSESIVNGMKQVTITPNSSATTGSSITINSVANFTGDCTASSPSKSFKILDSTTPPTPAGNFNVTLPINESSICTATTFDINFVPTNGFNNGITTLSPAFLWGPGDEIHYQPNKSTAVTVCYKNLCTGQSTCKVFNVFPPAPCESASRLSATILVAPNPSNGIFNVTLPETLSGNYQIFDQTNTTLVQEAKFDNQNELQIELANNLESGIYILNIITENNNFTERIILNN